MDILAEQQGWLKQLQALQTRRPILIQHAVEEGGGWHAFPCDHGEIIHLRSVLITEVIFESDDAYSTNLEKARGILQALGKYGIKPVVAWSGSKSIHIHVFLDPSLKIDEPMGTDLGRLHIDPLNIVREIFWRALIKEAGLQEEDFDRAPITWSSRRKGRMVRMLGCPRPNGHRKVIIPDGNLPQDPHELPWTPPPSEVSLADLTPWVEIILEELSQRIRRALEFEDNPREVRFPARVTVDDIPCAEARLSGGDPPGKRYDAALGLAILARSHLGLTAERTMAILHRYFVTCAEDGVLKHPTKQDEHWADIEPQARKMLSAIQRAADAGRGYNYSCTKHREMLGDRLDCAPCPLLASWRPIFKRPKLEPWGGAVLQ